MNRSARLCNVWSWTSRPKGSLVHRISPHLHTTYASSPSTRFCPFPNPNINVYYYLSIRRRHHVTLSSCRASACNQPPSSLIPSSPPTLPIHHSLSIPPNPKNPTTIPYKIKTHPLHPFSRPTYPPTYPPTYLAQKTPPPPYRPSHHALHLAQTRLHETGILYPVRLFSPLSYHAFSGPRARTGPLFFLQAFSGPGSIQILVSFFFIVREGGREGGAVQCWVWVLDLWLFVASLLTVGGVCRCGRRRRAAA